MELDTLFLLDEDDMRLYKAACVSERLSWANQWSQHELVGEVEDGYDEDRVLLRGVI